MFSKNFKIFKVLEMLISLDFSRSFATVKHEILCAKLWSQFSIGSTAMVSVRQIEGCVSGACLKALFLDPFVFALHKRAAWFRKVYGSPYVC